MDGYAVVDVEATGLLAGGHDRVVEVAVVLMGLDGAVTDRWCTLVNPQRDLGPQHIHRISAADVRGAPTFDRIAGALARLFAGRVPVGHNIGFDLRILEAEFARLGHPVPLVRSPSLCTMRLASSLLPHASARSLSACCAAAGVRLENAHSALHDALATAELFAYYLKTAGTPPPWSSLLRPAAWPVIPEVAFEPALRGNATRREHFLARIVDRLPRVDEPEQADGYLALLDDALLDGYLSLPEQDDLVATAAALGLGRTAVATLHRDYLYALAVAAWADGVVTAEETAELEQVADLLGLAADDVRAALRLAAPGAVPVPRPPVAVRRVTVAPGDAIVLTGTMKTGREVWTERAEAAGLVVRPHVTRKTRLVVAADPDSQSGKARQARDHGIPIVGEDAFGRMLADLERRPAGANGAG